jgi:copper chaperone CopZ
MKKMFLLVLIVMGLKTKAQVVTHPMIVKGNCEECKTRIENAGDIKGVKLLEWNPDTKVAKVVFNSSKTNIETIEKAIAKRGYDTPTQKGDGEAYITQPKCCQYRDNVCTDKK